MAEQVYLRCGRSYYVGWQSGCSILSLSGCLVQANDTFCARAGASGPCRWRFCWTLLLARLSSLWYLFGRLLAVLPPEARTPIG